MKVSPLFGTGAVLCRKKEIRIFGEAEGNTPVCCELWDEKGNSLAREESLPRDGRFLVCLPPLEARRNCRLTIAQGEETVTAENVAIGEVYLAGGQSNMELELQNADEGQDLIKVHRNPDVRYFNVPKVPYPTEEGDRAFDNARWMEVAPGQASDCSAVAYFFAMKLNRDLDVPVGIVDCYWGGTSITAWISRDGLYTTGEGRRYYEEYEALIAGKSMEQYLKEEAAWQAELREWEGKVAVYKTDHPKADGAEINREVGQCPWHPVAGPGSPFRPAGLVDSMVMKVVPLSLTGFLWYQGEADCGITEAYDLLTVSLVREWRRLFRDDAAPFFFVQLPMWIDACAPGDSFTWPAMRRMQARARDLIRNSGMVCILDQGEWDNIHPTDKRVVGERMEELAKKVRYDLKGNVSPRVMEKRREGDTLVIWADAPIRTAGGEKPALLELAGEDGVYRPAEGVIEDDRLILRAEGITHPIKARYAWTDFGKANIFGLNGLPLEPFVME